MRYLVPPLVADTGGRPQVQRAHSNTTTAVRMAYSRGVYTRKSFTEGRVKFDSICIMAASRFFDSNSSLAKVHHRLFQVSLAAPLQLLQTKLLCPQSETTQPLYLRTRSDRFVYRSAIVMSLAGLCVTACALFSMALGSRRSRNKHET